MQTVVLKSGVLNGNGRIYTKEALEKAVELFKDNQETMFGQIGEMEHFSPVDLSKVSHRVNSLIVEDDLLIADIDVLPTPEGDKLKDLLKYVVFRPSIIGNINENKEVEIKELVTFNVIPKETDSFKNLI